MLFLLVGAGYCEKVLDISRLRSDGIDIKWRARWVPKQLRWLESLGQAWPGVKVHYYDLLDKYDVQTQFKWRALLRLFVNAFRSGILRVPESAIEGRLSIQWDAEAGAITSMTDRIWLVPLFRSLKVKNRRIARDMLLWQELRQPADQSYTDWDRSVSEDLQIDEVPGMGQFDIDGLSEEGRDNAYASVFFVMGVFVVLMLSLGVSYSLVQLQQGPSADILSMLDSYNALE
jgi:hypothetical protein